MKTQIVVLDAMGVIYSIGEDVTYLLYPFIVEKGGTGDIDSIMELYLSMSLGKITSVEFWKSANLDRCLEDEYIQRHTLTGGLIGFLDSLVSRKVEVWCLSNDVSEWSLKLRNRFGLEKYFKDFIISGDIGLRKPDPAIFRHLLERTQSQANDIVFVDDNAYNLDAAASVGIRTVLFGTASAGSGHVSTKDFNELLAWLE